MPPDDRFRFHDDQHILPASPTVLQGDPEQPVQTAQRRPGSPPFEDGQLLTKGKEFESRVGAAPEVHADSGKQGEEESNHGSTVVTRRNAAGAVVAVSPKAVEFTVGGVLATHSG